MALKKTIKTSANVDASYWTLFLVSSNRRSKYIEISLAGYVDEPTRRAVNADGTPEFVPADTASMLVNGPDYDKLTANGPSPSYADVYAYLLTKGVFAGAESV
jgi:hypothetical protein